MRECCVAGIWSSSLQCRRNQRHDEGETKALFERQTKIKTRAPQNKGAFIFISTFSPRAKKKEKKRAAAVWGADAPVLVDVVVILFGVLNLRHGVEVLFSATVCRRAGSCSRSPGAAKLFYFRSLALFSYGFPLPHEKKYEKGVRLVFWPKVNLVCLVENESMWTEEGQRLVKKYLTMVREGGGREKKRNKRNDEMQF